MTDPRIEHAAEVVRRAVAEVTFLGLDESLAVAQALHDAGCLPDPGVAWEQGFEAGREMARQWGDAQWWTLGEEPPNPYLAP